jgi:Protein of unknown function (DUF3626)
VPDEPRADPHPAIEYVERAAVRRRDSAGAQIRAAVARAGIPETLFHAAMRTVLVRPRIDVHFHPERTTRDGRTVVEGLLEHGRLRSQFETGISSGSPTAYPGGERDEWERRMFGTAYHAAPVVDADRPKYGALEVLPHPDGASPRFGSCYFVLCTQVARRCTFTFGGSQEDDALDRSGTLAVFEPVLASVVAGLVRGNGAFGDDRLNLATLVARLQTDNGARDSKAGWPLGRALDSFVEAQIHGPIDLRTDVRELVADPAFRAGAIGDALRESSARFGWPLRWHPGFVMPVGDVPSHFRGYALTALARRAGRDGLLDAAAIGEAANAAEREPDAWSHGDALDEMRTRFRRLWHVLVLRGAPRDDSSGP